MKLNSGKMKVLLVSRRTDPGIEVSPVVLRLCSSKRSRL